MNFEVKKILDRAINEQHAGEINRAFVSLRDAIMVLNEEGNNLDAKSGSAGSLNLNDLKMALVNEFPENWDALYDHDNQVWLIGGFEIRKQK